MIFNGGRLFYIIIYIYNFGNASPSSYFLSRMLQGRALVERFFFNGASGSQKGLELLRRVQAHPCERLLIQESLTKTSPKHLLRCVFKGIWTLSGLSDWTCFYANSLRIRYIRKRMSFTVDVPVAVLAGFAFAV